MGRSLPVWGSLSKGMFAFPQGDEYQVLRVLQGMFFSFTVHLVPPWKQMLCNLLSEGPVISSSGSTSQWLVISPQVEKGKIMLMRETRPIPPTTAGWDRRMRILASQGRLVGDREQKCKLTECWDVCVQGLVTLLLSAARRVQGALVGCCVWQP